MPSSPLHDRFLGIDLGSSSIKVCLFAADRRTVLGEATLPTGGLEIISPRPGWAEQAPEEWWRQVKAAISSLRRQHGADLQRLGGIGIAYQMHGLVLVDRAGTPLRRAILWCDGRAVPLAEELAAKLPDRPTWLRRHGNLPGNFTATRIAWVARHEPRLLDQAWKALLPGDWLALALTGEAGTTSSGLSEAILWDYPGNCLSAEALALFGLPKEILPSLVPTFGLQGRLTPAVAQELELPVGVPITYRAGDQPNQALALGVLEPGQVAAGCGTSGVVFAVTEHLSSAASEQVNVFLHVGHAPEAPRLGLLLCLSGAGSLQAWLSRLLGSSLDGHAGLDRMAAGVPFGSDGLLVLPFGNGAERILSNRDPGASFHGLRFSRHGVPHLARAAQEGIALALDHGLGAMRRRGCEPVALTASRTGLFRSPVFASTLAILTGLPITLVESDGAQGAARAAAFGAGYYPSLKEATQGLREQERYEPRVELAEEVNDLRQRWQELVNRIP